ncbi:hypothetical protein F4782DRAFT_404961 [Xylaria castorea]|nr:hypothetical protein F4782DRAFT_404961 [Xylaria castorea]
MSPSASSTTSPKSSTGSLIMQPSEASASYFPKDAIASTIVSATSAADTSETPLTGTSPNYPLSPMDREYMKPLQDIDVAKQLSKQPTYWSVKGWVQRTASSGARPVAENPEARARKFEETKKDLLASVGRF